MGYKEAIEDNIPIQKDKQGFEWFYPPCRICGAAVPTWGYIRGTKYICRECRKLLVSQYRDSVQSTEAGKKTRKLESAIKRIRKVAPIEKYRRAIGIVQKHLDRPGWFQSTEEIMTAIELIRRNLKIRHQVKVFDFSVDFVIPEYKVALEVDGKPFHGKDQEEKQRKRDEVIQWKLGEGWEVIHIDANSINMNVTRLLSAIKGVLAFRKKSSQKFT